MKLKLKLIAFILTLLIIPVILITIVASDVINKNCMDVQVNHIGQIVSNQANNINYLCENFVAETKRLAADPELREYAASIASGDANYEEETEDYLNVVEKMELFKSYDEAVKKVMIMENSGIIIASTNPAEKGRRFADYRDVFNMSTVNNGVSSFSMTSSASGAPTPEFSISKLIYDNENEKCGVLYVTYDTINIQKYLNNVKFDKYTTAALMDGSGWILEYPYKSLKKYNMNANYSPYASYLESILGGSGDSLLEVMTNVGRGASEKLYYTSRVSNSGWYLLTVTDKSGLDSTIDKFSSKINLIAAASIFAALILTIMFAMRFTAPVDEIIRVFAEKQKGNANVHFDIRSNDEFRQIGTAFNSMFDNIFESEQRYRTIVEMTYNIIFEINYKKGTVFVSKNFNKKFSFRPKDDTLQESFLYKLRIHKDDKARYMADLEKILGPANFMQSEYRVKSIYGDFIWIMIKATKFYDRNEVPTKIVGVIVDIDREKKSEMHLLQRASYDNLTQLYNRETFLKSLANEIEISTVKKSLDAVMFIDLDDFKFFNDEYGHACGDEVLKFVADTLKEISFERGFAGRFGGDEFVVCFTNLTLYGDSGKIAQEIIDVLGKGFTSESTGLQLSIKCSIGIAFLRESGKTTEEIIAAADEAMYNIKKHGKSAYTYAKSGSKSDIPITAENIAPMTSAIDSDANLVNAAPDSINDSSFSDPIY